MNTDEKFVTYDEDGNPVWMRAKFMHATFDEDGTMHSRDNTHRWIRITRSSDDNTVVAQFVLQFRAGKLRSMGLRPAIKGALPTQIIDYEWGRFDYYVDDVMAPQNVEKTIGALDLTDEEKDALRDDSQAGAARQRAELEQGATRQAVDRMKRTHPAYTYPVIYGDVGLRPLAWCICNCW